MLLDLSRAIRFRALAASLSTLTALSGWAGCSHPTSSGPASTDASPSLAASPPSDTAKTPRVLPPEPPAPNADLAADVPKLESELAAQKAYAGIWDPVRAEDLKLLLSGESMLLVQDGFTADMNARLKAAKLDQAAIQLFVIYGRGNKFPADFTKRVQGYLGAVKSSPRSGTWAPPQKGQAPTDFTVVALILNRDQPAYVREFLAAKQDGPFPWAHLAKAPSRSYLASERGALEWLALLTQLTPDESSRLASLAELAKQPKLGQEFKLGDFTYVVKKVTTDIVVGTGLAEKRASEGARFAVVDFSIRNDTNATATVMTDDFRIVDAQGREFRPSSEANTALVMSGGKDLALTELQPGLAKKMQTAFELPDASAKGTITLVIPEKGLLGTGSVRITLK